MVTETQEEPPAEKLAAKRPPPEADVCAGCGAAVTGPYCAGCGACHARNRSRSLGELGREMVTEHLGLETRLFRTLYELFAKPGKPTAQYLAGKRRRYLKPLRLFLGVSALSFLMMSVYEPMSFSLEDLAAQAPGSGFDTMLEEISAEAGVSRALVSERFEARVNQVLPIMNLVGPFVFALLLKLLYLGTGRYYYDHVIFALHFTTVYILLGTLALPLYGGIGSASSNVYIYVSSLSAAVYLYLMQRRVYPGPLPLRLVQFLALVVGFMVQGFVYAVGAFTVALMWLVFFSF